MKFDIFFSICQSEVDGVVPSEKVMFANFFSQLKLADELGFENAWIAEAHLSTESQKKNKRPVVPNFKGEIGLNTDIFQMAHKAFAVTKNINIGSAIMNLLANGGPIARAEQCLSFLALHGIDPTESRRLNLGFASGRFPYQIEPYGIKPRDEYEEVIWPILKGKVFRQATEIFLRLLKGEEISTSDLHGVNIKHTDFRDEESLEKAKTAFKNLNDEQMPSVLNIKPFYEFENVKICPNTYNANHLDLFMGSHDPKVVELANKYLPCKVFNLSIAPRDQIERTHEQMQRIFNPAGGEWKRDMMPRTVMVFINDDNTFNEDQKNSEARKQGLKAMEGYWKAMQGTVNTSMVEKAVDNTLCGSPSRIIEQLKQNYDANDRVMLWFDFNNHDTQQVEKMMRTFAEKVLPNCEK